MKKILRTAPCTWQHSIPQSSNYHNPRLRKRRRLKIGNYFRKEIYLSEWRPKPTIEDKYLFPPET